MNKALIIGRLGKDVTLKTLESGMIVGQMSLATNEQWKNKAGELQKKTEWHQIILWGKQAENAAKYLKKGREVMIEGRIQTRTWDDKNGIKRYSTEIVAQRIQYLGSKGQEQSSSVPNEAIAGPVDMQEEDPILSQTALEIFRNED